MKFLFWLCVFASGFSGLCALAAHHHKDVGMFRGYLLSAVGWSVAAFCALQVVWLQP